MRHWFLILMIALLPLRGWAGDMMASHALGQRIAAATSVSAAPAVLKSAETPVMHDDCPGHAAKPAAPDVAPAGVASDCGNCTACQVCHSVAMTVSVVPPVLPAAPHARPLQAGVPFASAEPVPGIKPPIS